MGRLVLIGATAAAILLPAVAAQAQTCRDPWVTEVVTRVYGRAPQGSGETGECNIKRYNNGTWANKDKLQQYVRATPKLPYPTLDLSRLKVSAAGTGYALESNNGLPIGQLKAGNITISLPPNLVAQGGGNIVASGGGNMVASGGGNLQSAITAALAKNPPVSAKSGYSLQGVNDLNALKKKSTAR